VSLGPEAQRNPDGQGKVPLAQFFFKPSLGQGLPMATQGDDPSEAPKAGQRTGLSLGHWD